MRNWWTRLWVRWWMTRKRIRRARTLTRQFKMEDHPFPNLAAFMQMREEDHVFRRMSDKDSD